MKTIFSRLGGFTKFGEMVDDQEKFLDTFSGDITFGLSYYPYNFKKQQYSKWNNYSDKFDTKKLANDIKRNFIEKGSKARFVLPERDSDELNAAQITKNKVYTKGFELSIIETDKEGGVLVGRSFAVQDIEDYSKRDFDRPFLDKEMGTLPPKLARIMINLTGLSVGSTIWDPFCGSGTILTESLLNGYNVLGSDKDKNAIYFSEQNVQWLAENYNIADREYKVFEFDVTRPENKIVSLLRNTDVNGIVFEPFMGPPQKRVLLKDKAEKLTKVVLEQYNALMRVVERADMRNLVIVMVVPSYKTNAGWISPRMTSIFDKRWECLNGKFEGDLQWSRANSIIKRQIMIFKQKPH
jgi:tRNA G10  N-methylase Trm11